MVLFGIYCIIVLSVLFIIYTIGALCAIAMKRRTSACQQLIRTTRYIDFNCCPTPEVYITSDEEGNNWLVCMKCYQSVECYVKKTADTETVRWESLPDPEPRKPLLLDRPRAIVKSWRESNPIHMTDCECAHCNSRAYGT